MGSDIGRGFISQVKGLDLLLHDGEPLNGFAQVYTLHLQVCIFDRLLGCSQYRRQGKLLSLQSVGER